MKISSDFSNLKKFMEGIPNSVRDSVDPFVQSISIHYSCFEKMDWFVALQKAGCKKNRVIVIGKKKRPVTMTLVFCTLLFATHILDLFLKLQTIEKISGLPDKLK